MPPLPQRKPLTRAERARLERLLAGSRGPIRNFEALDGFFAALLSAPTLVLPTGFLPELLGGTEGHLPFDSAAEAQRVLDLLMRHWNAVGAALRSGRPIKPVLDANTPRASAGAEWARAYLLGLSKGGLRYRSSEQQHLGIYLDGIRTLAGEALEPPGLRMKMVQVGAESAMRDVDLATLGANAQEMYRALEPARRAALEAEPSGAEQRPRPAPKEPKRQPADGDPEPLGSTGFEVGVLPVPGSIIDDPEARLVAVVVVDPEGLVIHLAVENHPPADPSSLGDVVARELSVVREQLGPSPLVLVRDVEIGLALGRCPALSDVRVDVRDSLSNLSDVARNLGAEFGGSEVSALVAQSNTWAGWRLTDTTVAALFAAAARYYRAAPWSVFDDDPPVMLDWPDGDRWAASILGGAEEEFGVAFFLDPADFDALVDERGIEEFRSMMVSVLFMPKTELSAPARKELKLRGWEVAGARAYPEMLVTNSPTAGLPEPVASRVAEALEILAGMAGGAVK